MRNTTLALTIAAALLAILATSPRPAQAMMLPSQAVIADVAAHADHVQKVRRYCRRYCNRYRCWRRCWWAPRRYYRPYYRPYRYYRRY
ncbi:MAG: hypothetical protein AB7V13_24610 [Pseudorhodoplanes sp.]|uniref:hypothetical protein n=1 Tax=Pseudorhodoplanes sp. TaxID=1934341 RepID=UPI003D0B2516